MNQLLSEKQIEIAAKMYCELAGINPDKLVQAPTPTDDRGFTYDVFCQQKQWIVIADSIRQQNLINQSINYAYESNEPN